MVDDEVKRMHYYDGLFLKEDDFNTDQNYYIRMRRLMNSSLNRVSGILEGLDVEPYKGKLYKVTAGVAFSYSGKEIVLSSEKLLDFSSRVPGFYYITIAYNEVLGDKDPSKGDKEIHIIEEPNIAIFERLPDNPEEIILAKVIVPPDTNWVSIKEYVQTDDRKEIGPALRYINEKVGIGTRNPKHDLDVKASSIKLGLENSGGGQLVITNNPNDNSVYIEAFSGKGDGSASALILSGSWAENVPKLIVKANDTIFMDKVGIGTANPQCQLDVNASKIKLGLEKNGGGQLIITNNKDDNSIYLEAFNSRGCGSADALILSGIEGQNVPWLDAKADNIVFSGNVGIGTTPSEKPLVVQAKGLNGELIGFVDDAGRTKWHINQNYNNKSGLNFVETGVTDGRLFIQAGGNVGIGTTSPKKPLVIREKGANGELIGFEDPAGRTKWHINQNYGNKSGLNFVETGVADGRLFIQAGGNVGIGTTDPSERLEVNGTVKAGKFVGDGSGLTGIAGQWTEVPGGISYSAGKVGIGVYNPQHDLDVKASSIKLGLEKNGGGQLVITNNSKDDNSIYLEAQNSKGSHDSASEFVFSGTEGRNVPVLRANADDTIFSGNVGIGTTTAPDSQLHLFGGNGDLSDSEGDLKIGDEIHRLKIGVVKSGAQAGDVRIRAEGGKNRLMLGGGKEDTLTIVNEKVGIGTTNPVWDLDISAKTIKLGLEKAGGGQLVIKNNPNDDEIYLEAFGSFNGSAKALHITGADNLVSLPALFLKADKTYIDGDLDVTAQGIKLGLEKYGGGSLCIVNNKDDKGIYLEACGSADELGNAAFLTICGNSIRNVPTLNLGANNTNFGGNINVQGTVNANQNLSVQGNVGIGTTGPGWPLVIRAKGLWEELVSFEDPNGNTKWHINQNAWGNNRGLNFAETGVADGRLFIQAGGNVGIGTMSPKAKLDVSGDAYFGTDENGQNHKIVIRGPNSPQGQESFQELSYEFSGAGSAKIRAFRGGWWDTYMQFLTSPGSDKGDDPQVRMHINGDGNIGIGTTDPSAKLHVQGSISINDYDLRLRGGKDGNHGIGWYGPGKPFADTDLDGPAVFGNLGGALGTNHEGAQKVALYWNSDGNVGIGTTTPSAKLEVKGTFNATQKNFSINHPRKPETHNLVHSTLEGPEVAVFYRGEDKLHKGEVEVKLPNYFEYLTRKDYRTVLLTPKFEDETEISMLAASEVKDGRFTVKMIDDKNPSQKFYWEVKAIRADVEILEVESVKTPVNSSV